MKRITLQRICKYAVIVLALELILLSTLVLFASTHYTEIEQTTEPVVIEEPAPILYEFPPYYMQYDERWADISYATNNIEQSGCGLCAAASYLSFYLQEEITPADLVDEVGNTCVVYGVNDMSLFLEYFADEYGVQHSDIFWTKDEAYRWLDAGYLLFAGVDGQVGPNTYGGHVVLLWKQYGHINVMDSASDTLGGLTNEEFFNADFTYFYWMQGPEQVRFN